MQTDDRDNLRKNLVHFRKLHKFTQLQIAEKLGYSNKNISKWENGEITPDIFILKKLADIYNISVDDFFSGEKESKEIMLQKEIAENLKIKQKLLFMSLISVIFFVSIISMIISIIFISNYPESNFTWLPYLYGGTVILFIFFTFYKTYNKLISTIFLVGFVATLFCSLFFTFNYITPWIFLLTIPTFFFIYFFSSMCKLVKKYLESKRKNTTQL